MTIWGESVKSLIQTFERKVSENSLVKSTFRTSKSFQNSPTSGKNNSGTTSPKSNTSQSSISRSSLREAEKKIASTPKDAKLVKTFSGVTTTFSTSSNPNKLSKAYKSEFTLIPTFEEPVVQQSTQLSNLPPALSENFQPQDNDNHSDNQSSYYSEISDITDTASWASSKKSFKDDSPREIKGKSQSKEIEHDNVSINTIQNTEAFSKLKDFLAPICKESKSLNYYLTCLIRCDIRTLDDLFNIIRHDEYFLLNLGFDYVLSRDVADACYASDNKSLAGSRASRHSRNSRASKSSKNTTPTAQTSPKRIEQVSAAEIALLYYRIISAGNKEAFRELQEQANIAGSALAKGYMMRIYALGQAGVEQNTNTATKIANEIHSWIKSTVSDNRHEANMYAKYLYGVFYSEGLSLPKNAKEAFMWYKKSAELGYDAAQALVGHCFYTGQGVIKDSVEAVRWYRLSAQQGFAAAQCNLGICYELGDGVRKDVSEAMKWYKLAAAQGNCTAQYNLGLCYESGAGIKHNQSESLKYYKLAALQGHATAQYKLGTYYFNESENLELLEEEAFYWLQKSVNQGNAPAHCQLGLCYERGIGVEIDLQQAIRLYRLGSDKADAAALYHLAHCYYTGLGIDKNEKIAVEFYLKSAERGYSPAQNNLGYCYFAGTGVNQDYGEAFKWYKISAEHGYAQAQFNLGYCYEQGFGTDHKKQEMLKWYKAAAAQGHTKAEAALRRHD